MTPPVLTIEGLEDWARVAEHEGADDDDNH